jgi:hypothetical protein
MSGIGTKRHPILGAGEAKGDGEFITLLGGVATWPMG